MHPRADGIAEVPLGPPSGHHSSPSSYSVDGKQYIVAPAGWGGWAEGFLPKMLGSSHGSALFAFALPD